jgi:hypothetical protein
MINTITAIVDEILYKDEHITKLNVKTNHKICKCINYNDITGAVNINDSIILNTTAVDLELGTGGYHYVLCNLSTRASTSNADGHIMKLKYTPIQFNCLSAESQESVYHDVFNECDSLNGLPVIIGTLHSVLAPAAISFKSIKPASKIVYVMTDSGALPICISDVVRRLREDNIIHGTITCGNAFGGDLECINIYSALIAAKSIYNADVVIVCMGPGIVGTDTRYGFSGIEQGYIIDAVNACNGYAIAVPRISFVDERARHYGLSHHTITILDRISNTPANIAIPIYDLDKLKIIQDQIETYKLSSKHKVHYVDTSILENILEDNKNYLNKMGKGYNEDKEYFLSCSAASILALNIL